MPLLLISLHTKTRQWRPPATPPPPPLPPPPCATTSPTLPFLFFFSHTWGHVSSVLLPSGATGGNWGRRSAVWTRPVVVLQPGGGLCIQFVLSAAPTKLSFELKCFVATVCSLKVTGRTVHLGNVHSQCSGWCVTRWMFAGTGKNTATPPLLTPPSSSMTSVRLQNGSRPAGHSCSVTNRPRQIYCCMSSPVSCVCTYWSGWFLRRLKKHLFGNIALLERLFFPFLFFTWPRLEKKNI